MKLDVLVKASISSCGEVLKGKPSLYISKDERLEEDRRETDDTKQEKGRRQDDFGRKLYVMLQKIGER
jgi:hypothetical protein